jgi:acyl-CoA synthetase (AMP-forming)/AMP-acid ligase II
MNENWATLWEHVGDVVGERPALCQGGRRVSWREFDERSARLAGWLSARSVGKDSKVAVLSHNRPEYLETVFATFKVRGASVNLNFRYRDDELVEVLEDSDAVVLVFEGTFAPLVDRVRDRLPCLAGLVQLDDGGPLLEGAAAYEGIVTAHEPAARQARSGGDVFLLYTGGTTGRPRGVMWRHRDIIETLAYSAYVLAGLTPPKDVAGVAGCAATLSDGGRSPVFLPASPLIHGAALYLAQAALLLGGLVVSLEGRSFDAHELWRTVAAERVNQVAIVGDAFARPMVEALEQAEAAGTPYDTSSLERIVSSGVAWSDDVKQALVDRTPAALVDMIGASEGGPFAVSIVPPGGRATDCPFRLAERAVLIREDGSVIPPGSDEAGLLAVRPPGPLGYYKAPEQSRALLRRVDGDELVVPGDWAKVDAGEVVTFLGRGSLCINTGGEKVYPEEVEAAITTHLAVADCNVVGVPDERYGEAVVAVVALVPDATADAGELQTVVREHLAAYKVPRDVVFVPAIERTPAGKARYAWARQVASERLGTG